MEAETRYGALVEHIPAIVYVDLADERMTTSVRQPTDRSAPGHHTGRSTCDDPDLWYRASASRRPGARPCPSYMEARAEGEPFTLEYRLVARDGRRVVVQRQRGRRARPER